MHAGEPDVLEISAEQVPELIRPVFVDMVRIRRMLESADGGREHEPPTVAQKLNDLRQQCLSVVHMFDHLGENHGIELRSFDGAETVMEFSPKSALRKHLPREPQSRLVEIDARHLNVGARHASEQRGVAAADLEDLAASRALTYDPFDSRPCVRPAVKEVPRGLPPMVGAAVTILGELAAHLLLASAFSRRTGPGPSSFARLYHPAE